MEPPERFYVKKGYDFGIRSGKDLANYDVLDYILTHSKNQDNFSDMLAGVIDAAISLGLGSSLKDAFQEEYSGDEGVMGIFEKKYPDATTDQKRVVRATLSRLASASPGFSGTPTITLGPRYRGGALSPKSKAVLSKIKKETSKVLKDEDVGIAELPVEEASKEELVSDYELSAPSETAELFASQDFDDQEELHAQRAKEASLRAREFNGRYVNTPRGKTGATVAHSPAWRTAFETSRERSRKLAQLAAEESTARVTSATNNLRANVEARQLQQLQESRHAQAQAVASKARAAEHDRREAERRRERRELISNAYEVMYGEPLGDAINELGVEEEMRMAKQFYKIIGGKGSPGFLRKAYSPRAARVTSVAMERKAPSKRTTRKKKSVRFVLEEVDVPQKKISKRTYMKKSSGKSGKKGSGGKKGKGKGKKGKGKKGKSGKK